jgi:hypothetical protein
MHPQFEQAHLLSRQGIGAAIEVHRVLLLNVPLRLILNFHSTKLTDGVSRLILPGAGLPEPGAN